MDERLHSWAVIVTVLHTLSEEVEDKFEVCHLVWHSSASPPTLFISVTQFAQLRDSAHTKIRENLAVTLHDLIAFYFLTFT